MNRSRLSNIAFISLLVATVGFAQGPNTNDWPFNTQVLDLGVNVHVKKYGNTEAHTNGWHYNLGVLDSVNQWHPNGARSKLASDVRRFYQLLHDKKWKETYYLRAKAFREDFPESIYLKEANKYGKIWGLADYDVLSVSFQNSPGTTNLDTAILICRFTELPDYAVSYSVVYWHYEGGTWKCLSAGPSKLRIFESTRLTYVDWR